MPAHVPPSPQVLAQTIWAYGPEHWPVARITSQSACENVFATSSHEGTPVGAPDGAASGDLVGGAVGASVSVGTAVVGARVGAPVGDMTTLGLGVTTGPDVGLSVGEPVVGCTVGPMLGTEFAGA